MTASCLACVALVLCGSNAFANFPGANGRIVFVNEDPFAEAHIASIRPDGRGLTQLTDGDGWDQDPSWSANGRRVVFVRSEPEQKAAIYTMTASGQSEAPVQTDSAAQFSPAFSPSGRRIVYVRSIPENEVSSIFTIRTDGSDRRRLVESTDAGGPQYSPNGRWIVFQGHPIGRRGGIWKIRSDGSRLTRLAALPSSFAPAVPDWRPDGKRIVFFTCRPDGPKTCDPTSYVIRGDGSHRHPIGISAWPLVYSPSGRRFVSSDSVGGDPYPDCVDLFVASISMRRYLTHNCNEPTTTQWALEPSWQPLATG